MTSTQTSESVGTLTLALFLAASCLGGLTGNQPLQIVAGALGGVVLALLFLTFKRHGMPSPGHVLADYSRGHYRRRGRAGCVGNRLVRSRRARLMADIAVPRELLESLVERGDCMLDFDGNCQAHSYSLEPSQKCPQQELKELLAREPSGG